MESDQDPSWAHYPNTRLEFDTPEPLSVALWEPLGPEVGARLRRLLPCESFAVVTPYNPRARNVSATENLQRFEQGQQQLAAIGRRFVLADGVSPDGAHRERGFAVNLSREEATTLAGDWEQSALFWFNGTRFVLWPVLVDAEPVELPL